MGLNFQDVIRRIYDNDSNSIAIRSNTTVYAVVNTSAAGVGQSLVTVLNPISIAGNVTIDSGNIALTSAPTLHAVVNTAAGGGNVTVEQGTDPWVVDASSATIHAVVNTGAATNPSNVTIDSGTLTAVTDITNPIALKGNVTIDSGTITAVTNITNPVALKGNVTLSGSLPAGANYLGLATIDIGSAPTLTVNAHNVTNAGTFAVQATQSGTWTVQPGNTPNTAPWLTSNKGNVTIDSGTITAVTSITNPVALKGNLTINSGNISLKGNVTTLNAGTTKTLIHKNLILTTASIATIAVPTNTFKITNLVLSSNATTRVNIKSGASYLTGNASVGVYLSPRGGWVETGSPDSPTYIGLAGAAAIVLEKFDTGGVVSSVSGKLLYFDE